MRRRLIVVLSFILGAGACASSGTSSGASSAAPGTGAPPAATRSSPTVITREQITQSGATNALEAIQRLRSTFLNLRGGGTINGVDEGIIVYSNDVKLGGVGPGRLDILAGMQTQDIQQIQYLSAQEATQRYGTGHTHGAILITRRA